MKRDFDRWAIIFVIAVVVAGLALRLRLALLTYLNPDEALHALLAFGTLRETIRNSIGVTHPPLLAVITHFVSRISRTELALRLVPLMAGCLFPLLLFVWLRRLAGSIAAMAVLFLLTLAPNTIILSAQLRSYTLALLFLSASLLVLEEALESGRWRMMALYSVLLWLCIVSDYSVAWFVGAAGVFVLLRFRGSSAPVKATWFAGQLAGLGLYGLLFRFQIRRYRGSNTEREAVTGWLRQAFPQAGHMLVFPFKNTLAQFDYLMPWAPLGGLAFVLFAAAVWLLWSGRAGIERSKARALAVLLVLPFLLGIAGAYAQQFPYGGSRHTIAMGLFGAIGIAIFVGTLPRPAALLLLWGMLLLSPLWLRMRDYDGIAADRNQKLQILQCLDYMRAHIPPDTLVLAERDTFNVLAYYEGHDKLLEWPGETRYFSEKLLGGRWRIATRDYSYSTEDQYAAALAAFRRQYGLGERDPVWVLDGGWSAVYGPPDEKLPFTRAVRVFQAGAR